ncbi:hypothetical protein CALVIDRAFT_539338 [Calocera viscosa TUFC12733]|uniref:CASTOR ACT domain-containing protein n=1 Tax=Calocera viscosa (strain TUFC12733) TaxID=1330018 RepID=A0A167JVW9_CALVF|nr:hypothetical protein CALVIDRAFT_539338 [Calocera viscosa TUFC12733]
MPPPSASAALHLIVLPSRLFIYKLPITSKLPASLVDSLIAPVAPNIPVFTSITRTGEELSIVTDVQILPTEFDVKPEGIDIPWRALKVQGPMEHSLTGILNALSEPLKAAKIPIFAISTWNTDYVLITDDNASAAVEALKSDGWTFVPERAIV